MARAGQRTLCHYSILQHRWAVRWRLSHDRYTPMADVLETFLREQGSAQWRDRARSVIRELNRFGTPEAINGIEPLSVGTDSIGIGVNHQRSVWYLLFAIFIGVFILAFFLRLGIPGLRSNPTFDDLLVLVGVPLFLSALPVASLLLYARPPGPALVFVADPFGGYLLTRSRTGFSGRERLIDWREWSLRVEFEEREVAATTIYFLSLWKVPRRRGMKRCIARIKADSQLLEYWQRFTIHLQNLGV